METSRCPQRDQRLSHYTLTKGSSTFSACPSSISKLHDQAFPALYDWVSYPIVTMIKSLYKNDIDAAQRDENSLCHMHVEFLAALERLLCYCHTGNTAVFATSLMHKLGLSKGALKDGFPTLLPLFNKATIFSAMEDGFKIDRRKWPMKNGYPAIASKRAQVLTYSMNYFLVSSPIPMLLLLDLSYLWCMVSQ